ncbi:MAG: S-layer homology domain-containing protein [Firmicutes bacterium]|nr:S-layer homology domain-containing protein [Bacillota bacterium]
MNPKSRTICVLVLVLSLLLGSGAYSAAARFPDIEGHWAEPIITELADRGMIKGYPDGTVRPDATITRGEFAALLARHLALDPTTAEREPPAFDDIAGHWSERNIEALADQGVLNPADYDGSLRPDEPITRMEIIRMLVMAIGRGEPAKLPAGYTGFTDDQAVQDSDKGYVVIAIQYELVKGYPDNTIRPAGKTSRAEAFALLVRQDEAWERIKKESAKPEEKKQSPGGSGGGSAGHPGAQVAFELPEYTYTDRTVTVTAAVTPGDLEIRWSVAKDGEAASWDSVIDGSLGGEGGTIAFKEKGRYAITATVIDAAGRSFTHSRAITVYPVASMAFELPAMVHTDTVIDLAATLTEMDGLTADWSLTRNGEAVSLHDYVEGELSNSGGSLRFTEKGVYALTARVVDAIGREFASTATTTVYPVGAAGFYLPEITHTDQTVIVEASFANIDSATAVWTLTRNGAPAELGDCFEGTLTNNGGSVRFKEKGEYVLAAAFTDPAGRTYGYTSPVTVYPVPELTFSLPAAAHTDTAVPVAATAQEMDGLTVEWLVDNTYGFQDWDTCIDGRPGSSGGTIRFKHAGVYELVARTTDATGRVFLFENGNKTEVHPVLTIRFDLPEEAYTDQAIGLRTTGNIAVLPTEWSITKNGASASLETYVEGTLNAQGGKIRFTEPGDYVLTAAMTDALGRTFSHSSSVTVYPIPEMRLTLPRLAYAGEAVPVAVSKTHLDDASVVWSISADGGAAAPYTDYADGTLTDEGGTIAFTQKGIYVLKATATCALGRTFEYTADITVYPIPRVEISLPAATHTDQTIEVAAAAAELGSLDIEWSVARNDAAAEWDEYVDGTLTNQGGPIRFVDKGNYRLTATITDELGRSFAYIADTTVYPIPRAEISLPAATHTDQTVEVQTTLAELGELQIVWSLTRNGNPAEWDECIEGLLANEGGSIRFMDQGNYRLTATVTDELGRSFAYDASTQVYPVPKVEFTLPEYAHTDTPVTFVAVTRELGALNIDWKISKDGGSPAPYTSYAAGTLTNGGGSITFNSKGVYLLSANVADATGRVFTCSQPLTVRPVVGTVITLPASAHIGNNVNVTAVNTELGSLNIAWELKKDGVTVPFASHTTGTLSNSGGVLAFNTLGNYTLTAKITDNTGRVFTAQSSPINIYNNPPAAPTASANVTRTVQNGKFLVAISANSTDPDGDAVTYEYTGKADDNYYSTGAHTVRVRARDAHGAYSAWTDVSFTVSNSAPSTPVINRTPSGNSVPPGTAVTITASSTDPEGDAVTYIWEGRPAQTSTYPLGKNTVRVKAVDAAGAESPWAAIVFFVADANSGGGMTLTGPESVILEQGIAGATITEYTFTVPPVSGHSGSDYGRVRGYNVNTGQWVQLDYGTTHNGITFSRTLAPGVYSQLEFYYYTNHDCMYNKSNITYSVTYFFE